MLSTNHLRQPFLQRYDIISYLISTISYSTLFIWYNPSHSQLLPVIKLNCLHIPLSSQTTTTPKLMMDYLHQCFITTTNRPNQRCFNEKHITANIIEWKWKGMKNKNPPHSTNNTNGNTQFRSTPTPLHYNMYIYILSPSLIFSDS